MHATPRCTTSPCIDLYQAYTFFYCPLWFNLYHLVGCGGSLDRFLCMYVCSVHPPPVFSSVPPSPTHTALIAGLTATVYTFPTTQAGTRMSQITPDFLLQPFHPACTHFVTFLHTLLYFVQLSPGIGDAVPIGPMIRYVSDVHKRTTRQTCKKDIYIPSKARLNVFRNTILYSGAHILNNLPAKVKNVSSVEMFKTNYLNTYFSELNSSQCCACLIIYILCKF